MRGFCKISLAADTCKKCAILSVAILATCASALSAPKRWTESRSPHFIVLTNSDEREAAHVLDQFERIRWVFGTLFPKTNSRPQAPILVYAARDRRSFEAVEPEPYLAKDQLSVFGYFLPAPERNYIVIRLDARPETPPATQYSGQKHPFATVYHEYTHLQFRSTNEWIPLWLGEGLAEFFQNTEIWGTDVLLGAPGANDVLYLRQHRLIPLPVLLRVDASSPYYHEQQKGSAFYAESWALTHMLMIADHENKTRKIAEYMNLMSRHEDPVVAAENTFGNLAQLQSSLESYIQKGEYRQFTVHSSAASVDESSYVSRDVPQIEADATRAELLFLVKRQDEARSLIDSILKADPNNVQALETLGNIEFRAGDREAARAAYGKAVGLDSKSYLANYYYGALLLENNSAASDPAIESSLKTSIQLNPEFAPAYERLSSFYATQQDKLDEALALISTAVRLDPGSLYYRLNAAGILVMMGRYAEASSVLQSAIGLCRDPVNLQVVRDRIEETSRFQKAQEQLASAKTGYVEEPPQTSVQPTQVGIGSDVSRRSTEATGPRHSFAGVIHDVKCSYPSMLEFRVDGTSDSIIVYNDFSNIDVTLIRYLPRGPVNPCKDFAGHRARVVYAEATDKSADGVVIAIELRK